MFTNRASQDVTYLIVNIFPLAPPNWQPDTMNLAASSPNIWSGDPNTYPAVISGNLGASTNWESASSTRNLSESWQQPPPQLPVNPSNEIVSPMQWQGQSNPSFQQTSTQSLNGEDLDDLYGNRPASARSSYSNYHGVRATPQVPSRTDIVRQSQRQFVLSGPPAYQDTVIWDKEAELVSVLWGSLAWLLCQREDVLRFNWDLSIQYVRVTA